MSIYKGFAFGLLALAAVMTGCPRHSDNDDENGGGVIVTPDSTLPTVTAQSPDDGATNVPINQVISVAFSEAMNASTINDASFTLMMGVTPVLGSVISSGSIARFTPSSHLATGTTFIARVSTTAKDLSGNAMAADSAWSFETGSVSSSGPAPVLLGSAGNFVILAKSTVTTTGTTAVTGNIGLSPSAGSVYEGFGQAMDPTNVFSTSALVSGQIFAADYAVPTPSNLTTAVSNMEAAYSDAETRPTPDYLNLGAGDIQGLTLVPGLYKWGSSVGFTSSVTLSGGINDVWIFQIDGDLIVGNGAILTMVGGQTRNVFWQVAGQAVLGTTSDFKGIILCKTQIVLQTDSIFLGRALAQTAVTLDSVSFGGP